MSMILRRRHFGIVLIVIGLCIISAALYMHYRGIAVNEAKIKAFEDLVKGEDAAGAGAGADAAGTAQAATGQTAQTAQTSTTGQTAAAPQADAKPVEAPKLGGRTIAILEIPKINLKVAVGEGTDSWTLNYSIGHFEGTAAAGQTGNFALAGHRDYTYNEFFARLDELKPGDEILVTTLKGAYKYKVNGSKVVLPDQVSVLDPTKKPTITLVTCTPKHNPTHRLIVTGDLVRK